MASCKGLTNSIADLTENGVKYNLNRLKMEQITRIQQMEQLFDFAKEAMEKPVITLEKYKELQKAIAILSEYYSSKEWKQNYADDEAGLFPKDLKRGVLSEDGLWNLLADWQELKKTMHPITHK